MSSSAALKLLGRSNPFYEEVDLWSPLSKKAAHSLHYACWSNEPALPDFAAFAIERFSKPGQIVLDPFASFGSVALEACLRDRRAFALDISPLAAKLVQAKLQPADITEVMLGLQGVDFMRPISLELYTKYFAAFYDINTFRELFNLRRFCADHSDRVTRFVEFMALSLLHGHSAGAFSAYTFSHVSVTPEEQLRINLKRHQNPDYRSVLPRILKKTASATRDALPSVLKRQAAQSRVIEGDACRLTRYFHEGVDLVVSAPPLPLQATSPKHQWLRCWFSGVPASSMEARFFGEASLSKWLEFMDQVLSELARLCKARSRVVLLLGEQLTDEGVVNLASELGRMVEQRQARTWTYEGIFANRFRGDVVKNSRPLKHLVRGQLLVLQKI